MQLLERAGVFRTKERSERVASGWRARDDKKKRLHTTTRRRYSDGNETVLENLTIRSVHEAIYEAFGARNGGARP